MNSVAAPRLELTVTVYPKARGLALGFTITAAPQLIARLTQVTLKNAVDYSSILLPFQRLPRTGEGDRDCDILALHQWPRMPITLSIAGASKATSKKSQTFSKTRSVCRAGGAQHISTSGRSSPAESTASAS